MMTAYPVRPRRHAALIALLLLTTPSASFAQAAPEKGVVARTKESLGHAAEKIDDAAKRAADIFKRVPCAGRGAYLEGSLPGIAKRLIANQPVTIIAFGSSSTVGYGVTSPIFSYPYRLADQLRRKYPYSDITVLNRGVGGEDTPQMMKRFQVAVLDAKPDLVIWQLGTNTIIKGDDSEIVRTEALVNDGIDRLKAAGSDVVLIDPQYVPATAGADVQEKAYKMNNLIGRITHARQIARFPRFSVMRAWRDDQKLPFDSFVIHDGLHLNDWGYACFAQLLGDTIIESVSRIQSGQAVPSDVMLVRPM